MIINCSLSEMKSVQRQIQVIVIWVLEGMTIEASAGQVKTFNEFCSISCKRCSDLSRKVVDFPNDR